MNNLINKVNAFIFDKNPANRQTLIKEFNSVPIEVKLKYSELTNYVIRILSLPYDSRVESVEKDIAKNNYSFFGKILSPQQIEVVEYFRGESNGRVWVNAPTSWGKTLLALSIIEDQNFQRVAIIVPSIFLLNELYEMLIKSEYDGDLRVFAEEEKSNKFIHILTPERYLASSQKYDFVVFDEFYKVSDNKPKIRNELDKESRGFIFRKAFVKLRSENIKYLLLSPWIKILSTNNFYENFIKNKVKLFDYVNPVPYSTTFRNIVEFDGNYKDFINSDKCAGGISLIFSQSYSNIREVGDYLLNVLPDINLDNDINKLFNPEGSFNATIMASLIAKGVVVIGSALPRFLLIEVANYIKKNPDNIKFILSTSSISEGVNLPIKNIFIAKPPAGVKHFDLVNLAGRAGRFKNALDISEGNIYLNSGLFRIINDDSEPFDPKFNVEDIDKKDLDKKNRKKIERLNRVLLKYNLIKKNGNLINSINFNSKEEIVHNLKLISKSIENILPIFESVRNINLSSKKTEVAEELEKYSRIMKIIGMKGFTAKQVSAFSGVIVSGIYGTKMMRLKSLESTEFLNEVRYGLSNKIRVIDTLITHISNTTKSNNVASFCQNMSVSKKGALQNDYGLPKFPDPKKHPFVEKYIGYIDKMIEE